ncbi:hypothetical protein ACLHDF_32735 [Priestia aryabhattai]
MKSGTQKTAKAISVHLEKGKNTTSVFAVNNSVNFIGTTKTAKAIFST